MTPREREAVLAKLRVHGACTSRDVDPDVFFANLSDHTSKHATARATCGTCPVVDECADYAIRHEKYGMWGGLSEQDRRRARKRMGLILEEATA